MVIAYREEKKRINEPAQGKHNGQKHGTRCFSG